MMLVLRKAGVTDVSAITQLSHQLGYEISESGSFSNLEYILNSKYDIVFVAEYENKVVGWIQVSKLIHLETGMFCEIVGLVIDATVRNKGIGRQMVEQAIEWTKANNCKRLVVRSNMIRNDTHRFYTNNGFEEKKEQKIFEMNI